MKTTDERIMRMKGGIIAVSAGMMLLAASGCADSDKAISVDRLPDAAREFISSGFPEESIAYVKMERDFPVLSYEVMFTGGIMAEFDRRGRWIELGCPYDSVPADLVPRPIMDKMARDWPGRRCRKIKRDRSGYEVKLDSGIELEFDRNFNLMGIDD